MIWIWGHSEVEVFGWDMGKLLVFIFVLLDDVMVLQGSRNSGAMMLRLVLFFPCLYMYWLEFVNLQYPIGGRFAHTFGTIFSMTIWVSRLVAVIVLHLKSNVFKSNGILGAWLPDRQERRMLSFLRFFFVIAGLPNGLGSIVGSHLCRPYRFLLVLGFCRTGRRSAQISQSIGRGLRRRRCHLDAVLNTMVRNLGVP